MNISSSGGKISALGLRLFRLEFLGLVSVSETFVFTTFDALGFSGDRETVGGLLLALPVELWLDAIAGGVTGRETSVDAS